MSGLLPSRPDTSKADEPDPRVIGLDSEAASDLIAALSSDTARDLLGALHDEPSNPAALAERVGTSLQNAQYHIRKLEAADLIEEIDTCYSEKGREMSVYAPADRPLVVFAGREDQALSLKAALARLVGGIGVLGVASVLIEQFVGDGFGPPSVGVLGDDDMADAPADADPEGVEIAAEPTPTPDADPGLLESADAAAGLPPGLLFFLGGVAVLICVFALWYVRFHR